MLTFLALEILPGDPAAVILGIDAPESAIQALREKWGLDRPILERYFSWLGDLVTLRFGVSYTYSTPVIELVQARLAITIPLALMAMVLSAFVAFGLGFIRRVTS